MFSILLNTDDKDIIKKEIFYFRYRYSKKGLFELKLYNDVKSTIECLSDSFNLGIVTSKPYDFVISILKNLKIEQYFRWISGVNLNGYSLSKTEKIKKAIEDNNLKREETIMVGDRAKDIIAVKKNNINSVGVLYGFGKEEDLKAANCSYVIDNLYGIKDFFMSTPGV